MQPSHKVGAVHVESRCKDIHIVLCIKESVHENLLAVLRCRVRNVCAVVLAGHKRQHVRRSTKRNGCVFDVACVNLHREHFALCDRLDKHILKKQKLVIFRRSIHAVDNPRDKIRYAIQRQKRLFQHIVFDGHRIQDAPVYHVKAGLHIRKIALKLPLFALLRIIYQCLFNSNKDLLYCLSKLKIALLQVHVGVVKCSGIYAHNGDSVYQRINKLVRHGRVSHQDSAYFGNVRCLRDFRHKGLILKTGILPDDV